MNRLLRFAVLALAALAHCAIAQMPKAEDPYVFAYFTEPGNQGIYLALSRDGYTYTPLNGGLPWIPPTAPGGLMRDVYITRNPDSHGFRMVFTSSWRGNSIGIASSGDLVTWTPQRDVKIMADFPQVQNTWAPETYWDDAKKQWLIVWSSSFKASPESDAPAEGLRLWSAYTEDWQTFSKPEKFFDPGFPVIDATMFHRKMGGRKDVVMVFKDQTPDPLRYNERWVAGPSVTGPWGAMSGPINASWSEGPSVIRVKDRWIVFYDHYRAPHARYEAVETADWIHWTSADDKIRLPEGSKHGSFFQVTEKEAQRLLSRRDTAVGAAP
jgi:hypothetical protein